MKKIGLFGGSFNPVHHGHLMVGERALEAFDLDQIWFVPSQIAPHKTQAPPSDPKHRVAMLRLATEHNLNFEVCDQEIRRGGISYTVDTVEFFRQDHPDTRFFFVIGSDSLFELHSWYHIEKLLELCEIVTLARPGFDVDAINPASLKLPEPWPPKLLAQTSSGVRMDISSSDIRHRVAEGMSIRYMVPPEVEMYIMEHNLYQRGNA